MTCQQLYRNLYVDKIEAPLVGNALILGDAVHQTFEKFDGSRAPQDMFVEFYEDLKFENEQKGKTIDYGDWNSYQDDLARGAEMVQKHLSRNFTASNRKIYKEVPFICRIPGESEWYMQGFLDGVVLDEIDFCVLEYKTTKAEPSPSFIDYDLQMIGYAFALLNGQPIIASKSREEYLKQLEAGPQVDESLLHLFGKCPRAVKYLALHSYCSKRKPWDVSRPEYECIITQEKLDYFVQTVKGLLRQIEFVEQNGLWVRNQKDPSTTPCKFCAYRNTCWDIRPQAEEGRPDTDPFALLQAIMEVPRG